MPQRVVIWIATEDAAPGSIAMLYGPDDDGNVDYTRMERGGGRVAASAGEGAWSPGSGVHNGPAGMGPAGEESKALRLLSRPLVFGNKTFAVKWRHRETGVLSSPTTVDAFVNAAPGLTRGLGCYEQLDAGRVKFSVAAGELI